MILKVFLSFIVIGSLAGCASTNKSIPTSHLQIRVSSIESQLDEHDQDINDLQMNIEDLSGRVQHISAVNKLPSYAPKAVQASPPKAKAPNQSKSVLRVPVAPKEVQAALKNAGYYQGSIDGKLGPQSSKAIKEFQADHNLQSDGIIGKKTWTELKSYLD